MSDLDASSTAPGQKIWTLVKTRWGIRGISASWVVQKEAGDGLMDKEEVKTKLRIVESVAKRKQQESVEENEPSEEAAMLESANGADEEADDDHVVLSESLTKNTYSIIYVADPKSWAFVFGLSFFVFQTALPVLALSNLLGTHHMMMLHTTMVSTAAQKWVLACALQFLSGLMFQFVIFVLIVQSTTVIGMLLNFAALGFITEIDDVAFSLAERGYFSNSLKQACHDVRVHKTPDTKGPWLRRLALLFFVLLVISGYTVIFRYQRRGKFLCSRMEVQFGDSFWSELPLFSGVYTVDKAKRENRRLVYGDEDTNGETAIFRYCFSEKAFVFGPFDDSANYTSLDDYYDEICDPSSYYVKSPTTESFDLLEARATDWSVVRSDDANLVYPVDHLFMQCLDCENGSCNQPLGGSCGKDSKCICNEGFFGNQCQFIGRQICNVVEFDHRYDPFPVPGDTAFPSQFQLVRGEEGLSLYRGKAVYAFVYPEGDPSFGLLAALVYLGRRYYFLQCDWMTLFPQESLDGATAKFIEYLRENLKQGYGYDRTALFPLFVSEPLDAASSRDTPTPANVGWFYTTQDIYGTNLAVGAPISTRLLCDRCNEHEGQYCEYGGRCNNEAEVCVCDDFFVGPRCEFYVGE
eukprot:scaffold1442_cov128-Cylindrotheca_fusiformis.AAC.46